MDLRFISQTALFRGCKEHETEELIRSMSCRTGTYGRGEPVFLAGETIASMGLVLRGTVRIENNDIWGNTSILSIVGAGEIFAEAYACVPDQPLMVDVVANEDCEILFLDAPGLFREKESTCPGHNILVRNLVAIQARKNLNLSRRIFHTSSKTIRGRLLSYFSQQVSLQGSQEIAIPFDRQQLADYLSVDRSALSKELGKMRRDGILEYRKNRFRIMGNPEEGGSFLKK